MEFLKQLKREVLRVNPNSNKSWFRYRPPSEVQEQFIKNFFQAEFDRVNEP